MSHGIKDCENTARVDKEKMDDELPYTIALKAESNTVYKESILLGSASKKFRK